MTLIRLILKRQNEVVKNYITGCDKQVLLRILFYSLLWTSIAQLDPFGVTTAAKIQSEYIFMRVIGGPWYQSDGQKKITVVLIDDQYLDEIEETWPLSSFSHDNLLNDILDYAPKAIFYDIFFQPKAEVEDKSESEETDKPGSEVADALEQFFTTINDRGEGIPIFVPSMIEDIGTLGSCGKDSPYIDNRIDSPYIDLPSFFTDDVGIKNVNVESVYVGWKGCMNRYPSTIAHNPDYPTPAFAIYQKMCEKEKWPTINSCIFIEKNNTKNGDFNSEQPANNNENSTTSSMYQDMFKPMMVRWGSGITELQQLMFENSVHGQDCDVFDATKQIEFPFPLDRLFYSLEQFYYMTFYQSFDLTTIILTTDRGHTERCVYVDTLNASWFLGYSDELRRHIGQLIEDRIILIGTHIDGASDYVDSPVNDKVPGVYLHAMALDNYLEYGADYYKDIDSHILIFIIEFAVLFLVMILAYIFLEKVKIQLCAIFDTPEGKNNVYEELLILLITPFLRVVIAFFLGLLVGLLLWWQFRFAPLNWIGIMLLSLFDFRSTGPNMDFKHSKPDRGKSGRRAN